MHLHYEMKDETASDKRKVKWMFWGDCGSSPFAVGEERKGERKACLHTSSAFSGQPCCVSNLEADAYWDCTNVCYPNRNGVGLRSDLQILKYWNISPFQVGN